MRQHQVRAEISEIWGRAQSVFGPVLILPYRQPVETADSDGNVTVTHMEGRAFILPERLEVEAAIAPEIRYRGIFEAVVYKSDLEFPATSPIRISPRMGLDDAEILWDRALLAAGVSDLRGTGNDLQVRLGKSNADFVPGATSPDIGSGIHAAVGQAFRTGMEEGRNPALRLRAGPGRQRTPVLHAVGQGDDGDAEIHLAASALRRGLAAGKPSVGANGFEAQWEVSWFGRDFPQEWTEQDNTGNCLTVSSNPASAPR